ncbi:class I SAM-dependent methyltransferase [Kribbella sp. CA-293567]|uniref:class I SAM-dependent methyltransferase n=1 Tax=Kribbella sp. CA-293567 TaxID=3002436 RepID=UPI0022DCF1EC|nr:class I SAM-dependent methyltransferase [Kribbella sp. CA-293567]WBQ05335.1 class I SAM-dependent methyltransferase [Kribbella sp. CA-293567]
MQIVEEIEGSGGLGGLARMTEAIAALETRRTELIAQLRSQRLASWEEIGQACGMTRQGASRRWSQQAQATSFGDAAAAYRRGRPPYPESAVDWLVPGTARSALDLGAGTGKLTQLLAARDLTVTAVEPLAAMREELVAAVPGVEVLDGSAEEIPLGDGTVDSVVVAQAWHWFDAAKALPEIARVLAPGGTLGLVWNIRDHSVPWVAELDRVLHRHTRQEIDTTPSIGTPFRLVERFEVRWEHPLTRAELLDLVASRSYVITMPAADRDELMHQVIELLDSHLDLRGRRKLSMPYVTRCTRARLT